MLCTQPGVPLHSDTASWLQTKGVPSQSVAAAHVHQERWVQSFMVVEVEQGFGVPVQAALLKLNVHPSSVQSSAPMKVEQAGGDPVQGPPAPRWQPRIWLQLQLAPGAHCAQVTLGVPVQ